jgi:hypothetical protein
MPQEGARGPYIALGVERKPLDQTKFDVGWRCIVGGGGGIPLTGGRVAQGWGHRPHLAVSRPPVHSRAFCVLYNLLVYPLS